MNNFDQHHERELRAKPGAPCLVSPQTKDFLNLARLPARFNVEQAAAYLNFKPHDIPILVARGFLKPLGRPTPNSEKYFARTQLLKVENDEEWLSRATAAVKQHWREKNARNYKPRISVNQH